MTNLGKMLKDAREQSGLTVKEVSSVTKIRPSFIENLEKGEYEQLPPRVYVVGFLRSLGNVYGVDSEPMVQALREELQQIETEKIQQQQEYKEKEEQYIRREAKRIDKKAEYTGAGPAGSKVPRDEVLHSMSQEKVHRKRLKGFLASILLIGFIVLFIYGLQLFGGNDQPAEEPVEDPPVSAEEPTEEPTEPTEPPEPIEPENNAFPEEYTYISPEEYDEGLDIMIKILEEPGDPSWIRAVVDGSQEFQATVSPGGVLRFFAREEIMLRIGNAGVVEIYEDGQKTDFEGDPGEVVNVRFVE